MSNDQYVQIASQETVAYIPVAARDMAAPPVFHMKPLDPLEATRFRDKYFQDKDGRSTVQTGVYMTAAAQLVGWEGLYDGEHEIDCQHGTLKSKLSSFAMIPEDYRNELMLVFASGRFSATQEAKLLEDKAKEDAAKAKDKDELEELEELEDLDEAPVAED